MLLILKSSFLMSSFENLEEKLDSLIALCQQLKRENQVLRERESTLSGERGKLMEQNEMARQKIETMINRLRNLNAE
jgi:cell division protein ZapB